MKILVLSNYYPEHKGGIEFVAHNLIARWRQRHTVRWMACDVPKNRHTGHPDDLPIPAWNFAEERLGFPYPLPNARSLQSIFDEVAACDVVHLHDCLYAANVLAKLAARHERKPLLVTQHVGPIPYAQPLKNLLQSIAYNTLGRRVLTGAVGVVFINEHVRQWFVSRFKLTKATWLIPNGVDRGLFRPTTPARRASFRNELGIPSGAILCLFVGRFTEKKGLRLIRLLAEQRPRYVWILIGTGEIDPNAWGLANVKVVPPMDQTQLQPYYTAADLFVLPSVGEGFPLTVQEALASGLPAVVTEDTALRLADAPLIRLDIGSAGAAALSLDAILAAKEQLESISMRGVEYARRWDWDGVARDYEAILKRVTRGMN